LDVIIFLHFILYSTQNTALVTALKAATQSPLPYSTESVFWSL